MKKLNLFIWPIAFLLLSLSSCSQFRCIEGSGIQVSKIYQEEPFSLVKASGSMKIILKQGPQEIKIIADDNIQERIRTRVSRHVLNINLEGNFCYAGPITVYLTSPTWEGIKASGAVDISSDGPLNAEDFELRLSGSTKVNLDINASDLYTRSSGTSQVFLSGKAASHVVELSGAGNISALDFVVNNYQINASGANKSRIHVLNKLTINSSGANQVEYRGSPTQVKYNNSGASSLKKID